MADEELNDGTVDAAADAKTEGVEADETVDNTESDALDESVEEADADKDDGGTTDSEDDDDLDLPMDEINELFDTTSANRKGMNAQMRRVAQRETESRKRVEETVKNTKTSPRWYVPLLCTFLLIGLLWAVIYYLTSGMPGGGYPIPALKQWNLLVAFVIMMVGFIMTVDWH